MNKQTRTKLEEMKFELGNIHEDNVNWLEKHGHYLVAALIKAAQASLAAALKIIDLDGK